MQDWYAVCEDVANVRCLTRVRDDTRHITVTLLTLKLSKLLHLSFLVNLHTMNLWDCDIFNSKIG